MTTDHDKTERERFEVAIQRRWSTERRTLDRYGDPGEYIEDPVNEMWDVWQARAALDTGAVPEGWRLVPEEATQEMMWAATGRQQGADGCLYGSIYAAMLDAAPQPPATANSGHRRSPDYSDPGFVSMLREAVIAAIREIGVDAFRKMSMFSSSQAEEKDGKASASAAKEPVAWRVRVSGDDPEEWRLLPAGGGADYADRKGYDAQPLYTAPPAQPVAVSVIPLEWRTRSKGVSPRDVADTVVGRYCIDPTKGGEFQWWLSAVSGLEVVHTLNDAKAACQADYEQRIRSAIVIEPAQADAYSQGAKEMREKCIAVVASGHHLGADSPSAQWARDIERLIRALPLPGDKEG